VDDSYSEGRPITPVVVLVLWASHYLANPNWD